MVKEVKSVQEFKAAIAEAKKAGKLVLVDFMATWCGPCKVLAPKLEELSKSKPDVVFLKVDVDELQDLAQEYHISAMPTIILIKNGEPVAQVVGANLPLILKHVEEHGKVAVAA